MRSIPIIAVALALDRVRDLESQRRPGVRRAAHVARLRRDRAVGAPGHDRRQPERRRRGRRRDRRRHRRLDHRRRQRRGDRQPARRGRRRRRRQRDRARRDHSRTASRSSSRCATASAAPSSRARPPTRWAPGDPVIVIVTRRQHPRRARAAGRAGAGLPRAGHLPGAAGLSGSGGLSERAGAAGLSALGPGAAAQLKRLAERLDERSADLRPRRPAGLDVALVDLELDADVALGRIPATHDLASRRRSCRCRDSCGAAGATGRRAAARRATRSRTRPRPAGPGRRACRRRRCARGRSAPA